MKKVALLTCLSLLANALFALNVSNGDIKLGEWNSNFIKAKQYAIDNHIPLVAFWGASGCGFCNNMKTACSTSEFTEWQKDCGMVLVHNIGTSTADGAAAKSFTGTGDYPRMRIYWAKPDGSISDSKPFCGRSGQMPKGGTGTLAGQFINAIKAVTVGYVPQGTTYYGGYFAEDEIIVTNGITESVALWLERDDDSKSYAATNWVVTSVNDGKPVTNDAPIVWNAGQDMIRFTFDLDMVGLDYTKTNTYVATLLGDDYKERSMVTVTARPYPYKGGRFVTSSEKHACLEADAGTDIVEVPVTRTLDVAFDQQYVISAPGKTPVTNTISWAAGEFSKTITVEMSDLYAADTTVTIQILDALAAFSGETTIACVGTVANSSTNPYWIGERTADTLAWGDWTMDYDAAKAKVAAADGDAYTLVLVGGSKWCPDCVKTDRWLLDQPAFAQWAKDHRVACVVIDLPHVTADTKGQTKLEGYPSLLSYESYTVGDRYVNACEDGEASRVQSGAGYLSRHGISMSGNGGTNATAIAARNEKLFMTSTDEGGLCRPDCVDVSNPETGKFKTGVPCLIVMDKTGRIIGRNFQFNNESPAEFKPTYIDRMNELLEQKSDLAEESNDSRLTTTEVLSMRGNTGVKTVSYNDVNDWYRIDQNAKGSKMQYRLTGDDDATVDFKVVQVLSGNTEKTVASATGTLKEGLVLDVASLPSTNCFVRVSVPLVGYGVTDGFFALTNENSTVAKYTLTSDGVLQPAEVLKTFTVASGGEREVTVELKLNTNYKFSGNDGFDTTKLNYVADEDVYVAKVSGTVVMALTGDTFSYQIWNTGNIAFTTPTGSAKEPAEDYVEHKIVVRRTGGVSGVGKVRVAVDTDRSTALPGVYEFGQDGAEYTWAEGDNDDWELTVKVLANDYCDGEQQIVLVLSTNAVESVAGLGTLNEYTLVISDNDTAKPGRLEIASVSPARAAGRVYAQSGSEVEITLDRIGGSDGTLGCTLEADAGRFDSDKFKWASRDTEDRTAKLSLDGVSAGTTVNVRLVPDAGTSAVSSASAFKIVVVAKDAPEFAVSDSTFSAYRRVAVGEEANVGVIKHGDGNISVKKLAGQLPGGVKYAYDATSQSLVFSGAPTAATGKYEAFFQVFLDGEPGTITRVTFGVVDPTKAATGTGAALNPACAKTRVFADLQVYSDKDFSRLVGLLTLTVPASGRLSAKYVSEAGSVAMTSSSWGSVDGNGSLTALLTGSTKKTAGYALGVKAFADGAITCTLVDPNYEGQLEVLRPGDDWMALDDGADAWKGYYTASLAQRAAMDETILAKGDGVLTLRMTSDFAVQKGKMAYAGILPNGKAFSGSRTLWGYYSAEFQGMAFAGLPVFGISSADNVRGLVFIRPNAATEHLTERRSISNAMTDYGLTYTNTFVWTSKEGSKIGKSYEAEFDVYGGYYDADEDFADCCKKVFETTQLTFFAMPQLLDAETAWSTNDTGISAARVQGKNALTLLDSDNDQGLTLSFNRSTGLVNGALYLTVSGVTRRATYKGVVMPGWGTASCSECGDPTESQKRPFVSGACWYSQRENRINIKYGCPFSIGTEEGR